jgi:hypothetical protein
LRERLAGVGHMGAVLFLCSGWQIEQQQKNTKIKYVVALDGHHLIFYMQQPTRNMQTQ